VLLDDNILMWVDDRYHLLSINKFLVCIMYQIIYKYAVY